jgi:hypothetical protein
MVLYKEKVKKYSTAGIFPRSVQVMFTGVKEILECDKAFYLIFLGHSLHLFGKH